MAQKDMVRHLFGGSGESVEQTIRDAQTGMRAILHVARKRPEALLSDPVVIAHVNQEIGRLEYALEILRGE